MSKGSRVRPQAVEYDKYSSNWDSVFGKSPKEIDDAVIEDEAFKFFYHPCRCCFPRT